MLKISAIFLLLFQTISSCNCPKKITSIENDESSGVQSNLYLIKSITMVSDSVYSIYALKNDSLFKLLSKREPVENCTSLTVGKYYSLDLYSLFNFGIGNAGGSNPYMFQHISGTFYNGIFVSFENGLVRNLFVSKNIKGLCYIK